MKVMTALQVKLTEGEYASGIVGNTSNLKAIECLWRAEEHFFRISREDNAAARKWVEKAIELDVNFAGAWALLGFTHYQEAVSGWGNSPLQSIKRAEECAQKALSINDSTAKAQGLMGVIRRFEGKYDEAVKYGEKAVAVNPNDPTIMFMLATTYHYSGRFDESIALIKTAMRICPYYPALYLRSLTPSYLLTGRYDEAIETCKLMLDRSRKGEINPLFAHVYLAEAYVGLGQVDKARAQAEEVLKINPNFTLEKEKLLLSYKDVAHKERHLAALRKAGLK
jgi:tetratricopeptide (TPR) repeat protein